ncbi:MAG: hypothetical protein A3C15_01095 [Candidatus Magasanikbacteria bacterium RIFCSPHIGHO2_02_FULL_50_9b]|uniref:Peptidase C39-like domain-containing protein n=1 Tax=Candidatus Magasanikbacteria bacterium RIFCSPHIGHO2_02_FULL_50_9b TaxID=1798682 RepID=A0A1F6M9E3_9BACT|nr:MAG: hypothetical protein A3C15_01095 [Candidatus Magasanikbacteria bacterium RIFCSPHIGHO2_02_FULL_50_9b]
MAMLHTSSVLILAAAVAATFVAPDTSLGAVILDVPFTVQAPFNSWRAQPFKDACEEAVIIMAESYYTGDDLTPTYVRNRILAFAAYEKKYFGFHQDTNSDYTELLIDAQSKIWGTVVLNPTIDQIKKEIDGGRPVIHIAYSPKLKNPHYRLRMNPYHVVLIVGYDEARAEFVTHDPGTRFGENYRYPMNVIMDSNHDYQKPNKGTGRHAMIFTEP